LRIKSSDKISGFPILTVRKFLRSSSGFLIDINFIKYFLKNDQYEKSDSFLKAVLENKLIKFEKRSKNIDYFIITDKGNTLAKATARKPILRNTAERKIKEFVVRVIEVRDNNYYLFKVKQAAIFGSYLTNVERLSDIDIAVEIVPKENDSEKHRILVEKRIKEVQLAGRRFKSYLEALFWPRIEVEQFLRARSSSISLEAFDDKAFDKENSKIIFSDL